jgi:hemerythrin
MFRATLRDYQHRYATSGYQVADARELINTVDRWLDEHICQIDVHLRNCVKK